MFVVNAAAPARVDENIWQGYRPADRTDDVRNLAPWTVALVHVLRCTQPHPRIPGEGAR